MVEPRAASVETVESDREHGSAWISLRALEALRDRAAERASRRELLALGRRLIAARPAMAAPANRVRRALADALAAASATGSETDDDRFAEALERAAGEAIERALAADRAAAVHAAGRIAGRSVLTLSRSGTVETALTEARPRPAVVVAESRPGGEGIGVAERLRGAGIDAVVVPDVAIAWAIAERGVQAVLVGADTVLPSGGLVRTERRGRQPVGVGAAASARSRGGVVNKIGTLAAALAASAAGVPLWAVAACDKVAPGPLEPPAERADPAGLSEVAGVELAVPMFEVVPTGLVAGVITEDGLLDAAGVAAAARVAFDLRRSLEKSLGNT